MLLMYWLMGLDRPDYDVLSLLFVPTINLCIWVNVKERLTHGSEVKIAP